MPWPFEYDFKSFCKLHAFNACNFLKDLKILLHESFCFSLNCITLEFRNLVESNFLTFIIQRMNEYFSLSKRQFLLSILSISLPTNDTFVYFFKIFQVFPEFFIILHSNWLYHVRLKKTESESYVIRLNSISCIAVWNFLAIMLKLSKHIALNLKQVEKGSDFGHLDF